MHVGLVLQDVVGIDEDFVVEVEGHRLLVFVDVCPFAVYVGRRYALRPRATLLDEREGVASLEGLESIELCNPARGTYLLRGIVREGVLHTCGLELALESLPSDDGAYEGRWIAIEADRISAEVLELVA